MYKVDLNDAKKKYYLLVELPYPSGDLHMGHWFTFAVTDILGRMKRMQGYNVFFPVGFDAFGLPAENAAIKRGINPREWTYSNIEAMKKQFATMGGMHDFEHGVITCDPDYYRWNQWIFLKMFEKGLAYRGKILSNWCPKDKTVLANENVEAGKCWRCGTEVVQKEVDQWMLKITAYAERLLWPEQKLEVRGEKLDKEVGSEKKSKIPLQSEANLSSHVQNPTSNVDWPQSIREGQNNWIGKSEGIEIDFPLDVKIKRFVLLHGRNGDPNKNFFPWLKEKLEKDGFEVITPELPNTQEPNDLEQAEYVRKNCKLDEETVIIGHSFGGVVAMRLLEAGVKVASVVFASTPLSGKYKDDELRESVTAALKRGFDFKKIKANSAGFRVISDVGDDVVPAEDGRELAKRLGATLVEANAEESHFCASIEPVILSNIKPAIRVFTKFPETIFGVTFMVVAPEHWLVNQLTGGQWTVDSGQLEQVRKYVEKAKRKSELERTALDKDKSGVFTGLYCINQVNGAKVPVWVADYVIGSYGTGAVMGVPGSDKRDFDFAAKYDLPILRVIAAKAGDISAIKGEEDVLEDGFIVNSGKFDGLKAQHPAKEKIMDYLVDEGFGQRKVNYHLHDWSISRQRYWGTPIPVIYCEACEKKGITYASLPPVIPASSTVIPAKAGIQKSAGDWIPDQVGNDKSGMPGWFPVPDDQLPVKLPEISNYAPEGEPPLAAATDWVNVKCPQCGGPAKREVDTMDTFVDSSWYFLRYVDPKDDEQIFDKSLVAKWLPADLYVGGAEHTLGHTLYSRFFVKFLHDIGEVPFEEYAYKRIHHGVILGPDGARMSKSKGNVVNPDEQVAQFGADAVRMYLAFMGPYDLVAPWNPNGLRGVYHFLQRVWELEQSIDGIESPSRKKKAHDTPDTPDTLDALSLYWMHKTIKKVGDDIAGIKYNTAVAALMEWLNYLSRRVHRSSEIVHREAQIFGVSPMNDKRSTITETSDARLTITEYKTMLLLLAPFAPHMTEELWQNMNYEVRSMNNGKGKIQKNHNSKFMIHDSVHVQPWPVYDPKYIAQENITIVVQVNGKVRDQLLVEADLGQREIEKLAIGSAKVLKFLGKVTPRKVIFVPGKLVNFVA